MKKLKTLQELAKTLPSDHPKPKTRREFIGLGLMRGSAFMIMPCVLDMVLRQSSAVAAECAQGAVGFSPIPTVVIDCAGGAALSSNFLPLDAGGNLLPRYNQLGIPNGTRNALELDESMGAGLVVTAGGIGASQIRVGLLGELQQASPDNLRFGTFAHASIDDQSVNVMNPAILFARAGLVGEHIKAPLGTRNSASGAFSLAALAGNPRPVQIRSERDAVGAVAASGPVGNLSPSQKIALADGIQKLSQSQQRKLAGMNNAYQLKELMECSHELNRTAAINDPSLLVDPTVLNNPSAAQTAVQAVYGLNNIPDPNNDAQVALFNQARQRGTVVYNALAGNSSGGVIEISGCDYHGARAVADPKDREIGREIGRVVELAHRMNTPVFISIISNGTMTSTPDGITWDNDSGGSAMVVTGFYDPGGSAGALQLRKQIGAFTVSSGASDQGVNLSSSYVSGNVGGADEKIAVAMLANWLSLNIRMGRMSGTVSERIAAVVPATLFDVRRIDDVLLFG